MKTFSVLAVVLSCTALPALGQTLQDERVRFKLDQPATIKATVTGDTRMVYLVNGAVGQHLAVTLQAKETGIAFDVLEPGSEQPIFGSGNSYKGTLQRSGDYRIRVYLTGAAAQRGEPVKYTLRITVASSS
jgi:hypothetical protein